MAKSSRAVMTDLAPAQIWISDAPVLPECRGETLGLAAAHPLPQERSWTAWTLAIAPGPLLVTRCSSRASGVQSEGQPVVHVHRSRGQCWKPCWMPGLGLKQQRH